MNLRKKKKKSKSFATRRSKKRRKNLRPQKPVPSTNGNFYSYEILMSTGFIFFLLDLVGCLPQDRYWLGC